MPRIEGSAVDRSPDAVQKGYGQPWNQLMRARLRTNSRVWQATTNRLVMAHHDGDPSGVTALGPGGST
jgi:hypothetical protein